MADVDGGAAAGVGRAVPELLLLITDDDGDDEVVEEEEEEEAEVPALRKSCNEVEACNGVAEEGSDDDDDDDVVAAPFGVVAG